MFFFEVHALPTSLIVLILLNNFSTKDCSLNPLTAAAASLGHCASSLSNQEVGHECPDGSSSVSAVSGKNKEPRHSTH